mmetsp:Transcript_20576/g.63807  ORF Transcript_20576/g.63807 Transcript_20576/m.63807 type:complete len:205 (-) Transcript_20576:3603-4217(-)
MQLVESHSGVVSSSKYVSGGGLIGSWLVSAIVSSLKIMTLPVFAASTRLIFHSVPALSGLPSRKNFLSSTSGRSVQKESDKSNNVNGPSWTPSSKKFLAASSRVAPVSIRSLATSASAAAGSARAPNTSTPKGQMGRRGLRSPRMGNFDARSSLAAVSPTNATGFELANTPCIFCLSVAPTLSSASATAPFHFKPSINVKSRET